AFADVLANYYYECNEPLLDSADFKATSSLPERGPQNARLNGILKLDIEERSMLSVVGTKNLSARWAFNFSAWHPTESQLLLATSCLQPEEKERIGRFVYKKDAKASLIGRLFLRKYVGDLVGDYSSVKFERDEKGKPYLIDKSLQDSLSFNVSHQGNFTVLAGEVGKLVGVDVMKIEYSGGRSLSDFFRLMTRHFSPEEWVTIKGYYGTSEREKLAMFCRHWCLKESYVKAIGSGITVDLQKISFRIHTRMLSANAVVADTKLFVDGNEKSEWHFEEMLLDSEHCVSVAWKDVLPKSSASIQPTFQFLSFEDLVQNCGNAWTAASSDFDQFLTIDLGKVKNITGIAIQGRPHSSEYVMEYGIRYGTNGLDYAIYKEPGGNARMFKGNTNGNSERRNRFDVPIIAQWIQINPTRWHDRISLRVELYGCDFESDTLYFNGTALVRWDLLRDPISASRETIRFRFKTTVANGVLMYSRGTQGDYFALQLRENRMLLNVDLGAGLMTSLSVGSLLDDNLWHDVVVSRHHRDIVFSVDRVVIKGRIKGEFSRLNLNREFLIGGVSNKQDGLVVTQNFTGCMENIYFNSTNVIRNIKEVAPYSAYDYNNLVYQRIHVVYTCEEPPITPVTFLTKQSHVRLKGYEGVNTMNVSFAFRTYEEDGLLVYHKFLHDGHVKLYLEDGKIKIELVTPGNPKTWLDNYDDLFNDGRWHRVIMTIKKNKLILDVDNRPMETTRLLSMTTGAKYLIGGGIDTSGFIGCMRMISVDGNYKLPADWTEEEYCCKNELVVDSCQMIDRCNPNPCKHDGICKQNSNEFFCDCANTGYSGAVCHTSLNPLSCLAYKNTNAVNQQAEVKIDVDGSGPLRPFPVTCRFYADGSVITEVAHSNTEVTPVDGFDAPGSFQQDIMYEASMSQMEALINRSTSCHQRLQYQCRQSRLFNARSGVEFQPYSWWVSRNNQKMDYWAGALPGSHKCQCGVLGTCVDPTKWCNCDAGKFLPNHSSIAFLDKINWDFHSGFESWQEDGGDIKEKEFLPVKQIRFGDTGNPLDEKEGRYILGPLMCEGDDLFNNVVTFRIDDASIDLPTFDMGHSGDIYFEFKTTVENAVIMHSKGPTDYIKISIIGGDQLQFQYQAGSGPLGKLGTMATYIICYDLSCNAANFSIRKPITAAMTSVLRKEARIVVDGSQKAEVREPAGPVRALHLDTNLVVGKEAYGEGLVKVVDDAVCKGIRGGATVDYRDGYVGCIRALLLNGELVDLAGHAKRGVYGVTPGCVGKCESNPCLNNGTCHERYDGYMCDCRFTAFKGPICADGELCICFLNTSLLMF
ncbi:Neurexin-4, partial [Gryllus bimaculatus]